MPEITGVPRTSWEVYRAAILECRANYFCALYRKGFSVRFFRGTENTLVIDWQIWSLLISLVHRKKTKRSKWNCKVAVFALTEKKAFDGSA